MRPEPLQLDAPPHVAQLIRRLPPDIKKSVKEAIRALCHNPELGEPLRKDLKGYWKFRVRRYRIIYIPDRSRKLLRLYAVGHRREIYDHPFLKGQHRHNPLKPDPSLT